MNYKVLLLLLLLPTQILPGACNAPDVTATSVESRSAGGRMWFGWRIGGEIAGAARVNARPLSPQRVRYQWTDGRLEDVPNFVQKRGDHPR